MTGAGGVGFPAFMQPPPMGGASGGPQQPQWGHMGGPSLGEGTAAPETSLPMSMHPWLAMQGTNNDAPAVVKSLVSYARGSAVKRLKALPCFQQVLTFQCSVLYRSTCEEDEEYLTCNI